MLFKIEIFSRSFLFRGFSMIENPRISFDYLTQEETRIICAGIEAEKGDYAVVSNQFGKIVYQGIVEDLDIDDQRTSISVAPLTAIFNTSVYVGETSAETVERYLAELIRENFIASGDSLQNIPGLEISVVSGTAGNLRAEDNIQNLYTLAVTALSMYGIAVDMQMDVQAKKIRAVIGKIGNGTVIEANLRSITGKSIVIGDRYGQINKLVIVNRDNPSERMIYYLHTDGTVDNENRDRIFPVFFSVADVSVRDDVPFETTALEAALEELLPQQYANLIELTAKTESKVFPASLRVGTQATILDGSNSYKSILTGYSISGELTTLTFGCVRADLTKILTLERRKAK